MRSDKTRGPVYNIITWYGGPENGGSVHFTTPVLAAEALTFYATDADWVIDDFSEFEIKLDFLGESLHITFKKD